jgi:hypothetical protein
MQHRSFIGGVAAAGLLFAAASATAQQPFDSKLQASTYKVKLVQALDECAVPTTLINSLAACPPTTTTTDEHQFSAGKLIVKSKNISSQVLVILKSSGNGGTKGDLGGVNVKTRLTLRVTKRTEGTPLGLPVTWQDIVLTCPSGAADTISGTGNYVKRMQLAGVQGCGLPTALAAEQFEKEIVAAAVINADTGEPIAVPGVRKK